ncbi:DNA-directed RNA polymerase subunit beta' [Helcococcus kunzii]|uniref:DNA-directed RNA polymerase subunit beta' n=1 Tax=Helcococcus kunzii TaxID=40091 RepID=UPI00389F233F
MTSFKSMQIGLASPEMMREWSRGEVKKPETINYRTLKPEKEGLFCQKIFGPTKDYECACGKYKRIRYKGVICEKCGVEVTKSKVRRERMGHIELATPVSHIWYFKGIPSRMGLLLDMSPKSLEKVLYFANYVVTDPGTCDEVAYKQILTETEYNKLYIEYGDEFQAEMGAEAIEKLLSHIDLDKTHAELSEQLETASGQKKVRIYRRLEVIESFIQSGNRPEWMCLRVLPVIPPDIRPMVQLEGGRFATSDLNDLYRRVINRNNRLKRLLEIGAPDIIVRNEKRMLQESVDALIDNGRRGKPVTGASNRPLKSLSDMLKGKTGRFRQNLLGKRVDYSGRSVIVVGPELAFYQCGLPKDMALELFKPFIMERLVSNDDAKNIRSAKKLIDRKNPVVWGALEEVIKDHPVLLNRAPTLHRLGIQAFEPVLVEGKAIKLHPLVCNAYNADFDGDQMAVHVPLSAEAQAEARLLMMSTNNILAPKDGKPITTPTQDMVLGSYYLTSDFDAEDTDYLFSDYEEMIKALENKIIHLHSRVGVKVKRSEDDKGQIVKSTVGRFIFNHEIPQDLGIVDRKVNPYGLEVDTLVDSKMLSKIIDKSFHKYGNIRTARLLDYIKKRGFNYSTRASISIGMADVIVPEEKASIIDAADEKIVEIEEHTEMGMYTEEERYNQVIRTWEQATEDVTNALMKNLPDSNSIAIMARSGARGSVRQIRQLGGMRGLMASTTGRTIEIPVKANFREGLSVQEFFISTHGSRKGLSDTAIRTADSGYLTRRLVDVSQDVIIREEDCGTDSYIVVKDILEGKEVIEKLRDRIIGRTSFEDILNPITGKIIVHKNEIITEEMADEITKEHVMEKFGGETEIIKIEEVKIRSALECKTEHGICSKCYGRNLATGKETNIGEAVGIIAAQSIGEPGTQLTMRTFHTGGVAGGGAITQGLPRVEELFEGRKPKGQAIIARNYGIVQIDDSEERIKVFIKDDEETSKYILPFNVNLRKDIVDGEYIEIGTKLTEGSVNPHEYLELLGTQAVQDYIIKEIQKVYRLQGVDIDDKHIEIIIKQMLQKVNILDPGESDLLVGTLQNRSYVEKVNAQLREEGKKEVEYEHVLLGITKASIASDSFLSAASFQETTRVLTDASIKAKTDDLMGLKENIIIGKLIPAGTGISRYTKVEDSDENEPEEVEEEVENQDEKANAISE